MLPFVNRDTYFCLDQPDAVERVDDWLLIAEGQTAVFRLQDIHIPIAATILPLL